MTLIHPSGSVTLTFTAAWVERETFRREHLPTWEEGYVPGECCGEPCECVERAEARLALYDALLAVLWAPVGARLAQLDAEVERCHEIYLEARAEGFEDAPAFGRLLDVARRESDLILAALPQEDSFRERFLAA